MGILWQWFRDRGLWQGFVTGVCDRVYIRGLWQGFSDRCLWQEFVTGVCDRGLLQGFSDRGMWQGFVTGVCDRGLWQGFCDRGLWQGFVTWFCYRGLWQGYVTGILYTLQLLYLKQSNFPTEFQVGKILANDNQHTMHYSVFFVLQILTERSITWQWNLIHSWSWVVTNWRTLLIGEGTDVVDRWGHICCC